ncbi:hypothetical protein AVEN_256799-1 [Araneus ventricosus]|uniref:Uncharacterized protein n=1 Tax=Araneus ventricosus TaxID=182803 RepID=A0A4Y2NLR5_ARAVE|nr:hypothetical protein AVEN_256799-1 [Araneus ventricosus]
MEEGIWVEGFIWVTFRVEICLANSRLRGCLQLSRVHQCHFKSDFKKKLSSANRKEERFLQKNRYWLENIIQEPIYSSNFRGRPQKDFIEPSERSKRRKTVELRQQSNPQELTFAVSMSHKATGNPDNFFQRRLIVVLLINTSMRVKKKTKSRALKNRIKTFIQIGLNLSANAPTSPGH